MKKSRRQFFIKITGSPLALITSANQAKGQGKFKKHQSAESGNSK